MVPGPSKTVRLSWPTICATATRLTTLGPLERILDTFDATISSVHASRLDGTLSKRVNNAINALMQMAMLFHSLDASPWTEALESYRDRACVMVAERWQEVAKWMRYLLSCGNNATRDRTRAAVACGQALAMLCNQANGNSYKEEVLSQHITATALILLLLQKDPQTGRFWDSVLPSEASLISSLLQQYCAVDVARNALIGCLAALSKGTRLAIVEAMVARSRETVSHVSTANIRGAAPSVRCIFDAVGRLANDKGVYSMFEERETLVNFTKDLSLLSEKASTVCGAPFSANSFWCEVSSAVEWVVKIGFMYTPHPSRRIAKIIDSGLLTCAFHCLACSATPSSDGMVAVLRSVLQYLYSAKAVLVRHSSLDPPVFSREMPSLSQPALEIWSAWKKILYSPYAFLNWKVTEVRKCNNIMVRGSSSLG